MNKIIRIIKRVFKIRPTFAEVLYERAIKYPDKI